MPGKFRQNHPEHDVLIFPRRQTLKTKAEFIRLPAAPDAAALPAEKERPGGVEVPPPYGSKSEAWNLLDYGARRAVSAARPDLFSKEGQGPAAERDGIGPGFAVLPVKPEPSAASFITCYLINVENLAGRNFWTVEEWSDPKQAINYKTPVHPTEFQTLIAGPWGKVYRLKVCRHDRWPSVPIQVKVGNEIIAELEDIDLRNEPQIWNQLRNGTVAGRTWFRRDGTIVPLVNITALQDELPFEEEKQPEEKQS